MSKIHEGMYGDETVVESGGVITVKSGARIVVEPGGSITVNGVTVDADTLAMTGLTASAAELNALADLPASLTMSATPASGSCAVQLAIKNAAGSAIGHPVAGLLYFSTVDGAAIGAGTSAATLTHGTIQELLAGTVDLFISSAAGLLGLTLTAAAGTYYASLVLPNGTVLTTGALVVNA